MKFEKAFCSDRGKIRLSHWQELYGKNTAEESINDDDYRIVGIENTLNS